MFKQFYFSLIFGVALLAVGVLSSFAQTATFTPGAPFYHDYEITNNALCPIYITSITKSWNSLNGAVTNVSYNPAGASSTLSSGSVTYPVASYQLDPGVTINTTLNFTTDPAVANDVVNSSISWTYTAICPCNVNNTGSVSSVIAPTGGGSSSSSSGGSSSGGSSSSSSGGGTSGNGCSFVSAAGQACTEPAIAMSGEIPSLTPVTRSGKQVVPVSLDPNSDAACFDLATLCTQIRDTAVVGGYHNDITDWPSVCESVAAGDWDAASGTVYLPVQNKTYYQVRGSIENSGFDPTTSGEVCHFDTVAPPIDVIGAENAITGDTDYAEARNQMNPNVARLVQPFDDWDTRCDSTQGVILYDLEKGSYYFDRADGQWKLLDECYAPGSNNVIIFDPPATATLSGGAWNAVVLDADAEAAFNVGAAPIVSNGGDFELLDRELTIVLRGSDLRLADNLVYPNSEDASFGMVVLKNGTLGGNVQIPPEPTNLTGALYAEGSVFSVDSTWQLPVNRSDPIWFWNFRNQLFWEGQIVARNTVIGSRDPLDTAASDLEDSTTWQRTRASHCPNVGILGTSSCSWDDGVAYDLAYLREFFSCLNPSSDTTYSGWGLAACTAAGQIIGDLNGDAAERATNLSDASVVVKYDSRIQGNPPPGFEGIIDIFSEQASR